jgi:hypothetical protein
MSNQRRLVGAKNPRMGRDNEEGNKAFGSNNE